MLSFPVYHIRIVICLEYGLDPAGKCRSAHDKVFLSGCAYVDIVPINILHPTGRYIFYV